MELIFLLSWLALSVSLNVYLILRLRRKPPKPQSLELQEFLGDLLSGPGIVAVSRIDPSNILLRSPKR